MQVITMRRKRLGEERTEEMSRGEERCLQSSCEENCGIENIWKTKA